MTNEVEWNDTTTPVQSKIGPTLATHFARDPSRVISLEVKPDVTPYQVADTLAKRSGGINVGDITKRLNRKKMDKW